MMDDKENIEPMQQQWIIKASPKKHDSFTIDEESLEIATSSDNESDSDTRTTTPKKQGILKSSSTPATGQSVRFGKRLYDDGDESKMSNSTANSSAFMKSIVHEPSEDAIEMSLGFIRSPRKSQEIVEEEEESSSHQLDDDSENVSHEAIRVSQSNGDIGTHQSIDTIAMPNLEGYSNLEDISLEYPSRDETSMPTPSSKTRTKDDSFEDISFNESFLQAEIEMAKRGMENAESAVNQDIASEATILVRSLSEEEIENETSTMIQNTPVGADSPHGSEYLSTRSQASIQSPASTVSQWGTPRSVRFSPVEATDEDGESNTSNGARSSGEESPSAQKLQRRVSLRPSLPNASPLFARLKSLTNTPIKRSPLSTVVLPPGAFSSDDQSIASVMLSDSDGKVHSIFSRSTCTTPSSVESPASPSANSIISEIIKESNELDQVHTERSEILLQWIQKAEEESEQRRLMLNEERERSATALQEAEAARSSLLRMKEESMDVEARRSQRLQEVEELAAQLNSQLLERSQIIEESREVVKRISSPESHRVAELEEEVASRRHELEMLRNTQEERKVELDQVRLQREEEQQKYGEQIEQVKEQYEERLRQSETANHSLQVQLEAIENSKEGKMGDDEEEKVELHRQLIESREEHKALQDALISAQKQIGVLQGEDYKDNETLQRTRGALIEVQGQLAELQTALQESRDREQNADKLIQEYMSKCDALTLTVDKERDHWTRRYEQLENENDNLLQSLAEAEEHRRSMEDDFLQKRDVALHESKRRGEEAFGLAEEMQSRLEKVEMKLQAMTTRTTMLEHEVGNRGLQLVKLEKAKERLEEDNLNYSIALSSKQQELSLLKRNTNRSIRNTPASAVSTAPRLNALESHTSNLYSRAVLREIQAADESGSSLAPLQSGPSNIKTMRRKTMDVATPRVRSAVSSARVVGSIARTARISLAMQPVSSNVHHPITTVRQKSPEEETKILGPSSRTSSHTSHRSSATLSKTDLHSAASLRSSSSSSVTRQVRSSLSSSSSIVASDGPMHISELQIDRDVSKVRQRLHERSRDLERIRVPITLPLRERSLMPA